MVGSLLPALNLVDYHTMGKCLSCSLLTPLVLEVSPGEGPPDLHKTSIKYDILHSLNKYHVFFQGFLV